jgi:hypothetical protein
MPIGAARLEALLLVLRRRRNRCNFYNFKLFRPVKNILVSGMPYTVIPHRPLKKQKKSSTKDCKN